MRTKPLLMRESTFEDAFLKEGEDCDQGEEKQKYPREVEWEEK